MSVLSTYWSVPWPTYRKKTYAHMIIRDLYVNNGPFTARCFVWFPDRIAIDAYALHFHTLYTHTHSQYGHDVFGVWRLLACLPATPQRQPHGNKVFSTEFSTSFRSVPSVDFCTAYITYTQFLWKKYLYIFFHQLKRRVSASLYLLVSLAWCHCFASCNRY